MEDASVWCSTPRNRLFAAAITKASETSIITSFGENSTLCKTGDQKFVDSSEIMKDEQKENHEASRQSSEEDKQLSQGNYELTKDMLNSHQTSRDLSMRQDVINKHSLRSWKKFYINIFKQKNLKIVRTRFWNVSNAEIMKAVKKTFGKEFKPKNLPKDFFYYLTGILKFKGVRNMNWSSKIKDDINDFHDCCKNYSKRKFNALFKSQCFKIMWKEFISKNDLDEKFRFLIKKIE